MSVHTGTSNNKNVKPEIIWPNVMTFIYIKGLALLVVYHYTND